MHNLTLCEDSGSDWQEYNEFKIKILLSSRRHWLSAFDTVDVHSWQSPQTCAAISHILLRPFQARYSSFFSSAKSILLIPSFICRFSWPNHSSASFFGVPVMACLMAVSISGSAARTGELMLE